MKRIITVMIIILLIIGVIFGIFYLSSNKEEEEITEYTPQEEISEEQMRQTMVTLYFKNENDVVPEARLIDVKKLMENPYEEILNMLLEGPKNSNLQKIIPEGTKIEKIEKKGENLIINFSEEFNKIKEMTEEQKKMVNNSIEKTITQLTEINAVDIRVNDEKMN